MERRRTPIGGTHARDWQPLRQQRTLAELPADALGFVRFQCLSCPRTGKMPLADLQARFRPTDGLVSILNQILPKDCARPNRNAEGQPACGWCYRDLGTVKDG